MFTKLKTVSTSSSNSPASGSKAETVQALKYTTEVTGEDYNTHRVTEYFIPTLNVGFNQMIEAQPTEAIDIPVDIPVDHTTVPISRNLAEQILVIAKLNAQLKLAKEALSSNQEYCDLLDIVNPRSYLPKLGRDE